MNELTNVERTILLSILDTWMDRRRDDRNATDDRDLKSGLDEAMANVARIITKLELQCGLPEGVTSVMKDLSK